MMFNMPFGFQHPQSNNPNDLLSLTEMFDIAIDTLSDIIIDPDEMKIVESKIYEFIGKSQIELSSNIKSQEECKYDIIIIPIRKYLIERSNGDLEEGEELVKKISDAICLEAGRHYFGQIDEQEFPDDSNNYDPIRTIFRTAIIEYINNIVTLPDEIKKRLNIEEIVEQNYKDAIHCIKDKIVSSTGMMSMDSVHKMYKDPDFKRLAKNSVDNYIDSILDS